MTNVKKIILNILAMAAIALMSVSHVAFAAEPVQENVKACNAEVVNSPISDILSDFGISI